MLAFFHFAILSFRGSLLSSVQNSIPSIILIPVIKLSMLKLRSPLINGSTLLVIVSYSYIPSYVGVVINQYILLADLSAIEPIVTACASTVEVTVVVVAGTAGTAGT